MQETKCLEDKVTKNHFVPYKFSNWKRTVTSAM